MHVHPVTQTIREIASIAAKIGFTPELGPELETEFYNFDALNVPKNHPSRDMQDTFWVKDTGQVLRTHTSSVQVRYLEKHDGPFRIIAPGRVFRNEATDATHDVQFYQLEGLLVGEEASMATLKGTILHILTGLFGNEVGIRFRPSYFPFVEPGVEVDMFYRGKWMEVMGAGMVHPKVFEAAGKDPKKMKGFAFGMGVDRLVMLKYDIPDVRLLYSADLRVLSQFSS
ncbi:MAG TPA: phenylalanine--tRNA ligase subunit alpha [Candidatus Paceibacterota bacterium]|nr:phenylalanine--tRNA ligase subunit alpha [Candidatus Paceibacterota bacterium]